MYINVMQFVCPTREHQNYIFQTILCFRNNILCLHKAPKSTFRILFYLLSLCFFEIISIFSMVREKSRQFDYLRSCNNRSTNEVCCSHSISDLEFIASKYCLERKSSRFFTNCLERKSFKVFTILRKFSHNHPHAIRTYKSQILKDN